MRFIAFEVSAGQFIAWLWPGMVTNIACSGTAPNEFAAWHRKHVETCWERECDSSHLRYRAGNSLPGVSEGDDQCKTE